MLMLVGQATCLSDTQRSDTALHCLDGNAPVRREIPRNAYYVLTDERKSLRRVGGMPPKLLKKWCRLGDSNT